MAKETMTNMKPEISLEFANTAEWHAGPDPEEKLTSYGRAVDWARQAGVLSESQTRHLLARAEAQPDRQAEALRRILALRESIYRIFSAVSHDRAPETADMDRLNEELRVALTHTRLVPSAGPRPEEDEAGEGNGPRTFAWEWTGMEEDLSSMLWPITRAVTVLLTSPELARVRECADDRCGWLFLDRSRNASRRWCDMADCGNRAKARRYRERKKEPSVSS